MNALSAARALGWFSIGLGLTELIAPGWLARQIGTAEWTTVTRAFGLREIAAGAGILGSPSSPGGVWARVAGDVLDLGALGMVARQSERPGRALTAAASVAAVLAIDAIVARRLSVAASGLPTSLQAPER